MKIFNAKAAFYSRGDNSGTQQMELSLWKAAGLDPKNDPGYKETGTGMGQTLQVSSEKNAYTLTDRATYLAQKKNLAMDIMVEGDPSLLNIYHVITVNPQKWPKVNVAGANAFRDFLLAPDTQKTIGSFGIAQYGQPLFFADAGKPEYQ
jgi:tungstate transport system substrate-binding protein